MSSVGLTLIEKDVKLSGIVVDKAFFEVLCQKYIQATGS